MGLVKVEDKDNWYENLTEEEICNLYLEVLLSGGSGPRNVVYGQPYCADHETIKVVFYGLGIPILKKDGSFWSHTNRVFKIRPLFDTREYKIVSDGTFKDSDILFNKTSTIFSVRKRISVPTKFGLYLDKDGDPWVVTEDGELQSLDIPNGCSCSMTEDEARQFAPFQEASLIPATRSQDQEDQQ